MKAYKTVLRLIMLALAACASMPASAWHHGSVRFGVYVGPPAYWYQPYPYYYPPYYPAYAYPPVVAAPAAPPVYIEQGSAGTPPAAPSQPQAQSQPQPQSNWWHYCAESKAYYPYVRDCPSGWQRVAPQPQQ